MSLDPVQAHPEPSRSPRRWRRLGPASLGLALAAVGSEILAIVIGSGGALTAATVLAWIVIGLFALALVLGVVAVLVRLGRRFGLAGVILTLVANPLTLVGLFGVLGSKA